MNNLPLVNPSVDIESLYTSIQQLSFPVSTSSDSNVLIPSVLSHVVISKKSLKHVFHMEEIKRKANSVKYKALGGYHLIGEEVNDRSKVYRFRVKSIAPYVCEGFIVNTTEHLPVYKTFFFGLTDPETIQCFQESLQHIEKIEDQGTVWLLEGKSTTYPIQITSIVKKKDLVLKTFFPTSYRDTDSINSFVQKSQSIYRKYFFNPCYTLPCSDTSDILSLHNYFGSKGIDVRLKVVHLDARSIDSIRILGLLNNKSFETPDMVFGLLPDSIVETIAHDFKSLQRYSFDETLPSRKVEVLRTIDTIKKVFFDGNIRFPDCLTKYQILDNLKEAITNFLQLMYGDFQETQETDWENLDSKWSRPTGDLLVDLSCPSWLPAERDAIVTETEWDFFGGPVNPPTHPITPHNKYALEIMHK